MNELRSDQQWLFELLLGRKPGEEELKAFAEGTETIQEFAWRLILTNTCLDLAIEKAPSLHLYLIHNARLKAVRTLLPQANTILDLGGAHVPLYRMGYPYPFKKFYLIDLPIDQRYEDYKNEFVEYYGQGEVILHYTDMADLRGFPDNSADLIWAGQSIEHIPTDHFRKMCREVYRVLKPKGHFCCDTPNRKVTSIHTGRPQGIINPDHKIEYTAGELRQILLAHSFKIINEKGICEMPKTAATGNFHYSDFVLGSPISENVDRSYILFFDCKK